MLVIGKEMSEKGKLSMVVWLHARGKDQEMEGASEQMVRRASSCKNRNRNMTDDREWNAMHMCVCL